MSDLDDKKMWKVRRVVAWFKTTLSQYTFPVAVGDKTLTVGSENDLEAYKKIYDVMLDGETTTIKDRNNKFFVVTKEELFSVIRQMTLWGASQWAKKEKLLADIEKATTIEELENIQW